MAAPRVTFEVCACGTDGGTRILRRSADNSSRPRGNLAAQGCEYLPRLKCQRYQVLAMSCHKTKRTSYQVVGTECQRRLPRRHSKVIANPSQWLRSLRRLGALFGLSTSVTRRNSKTHLNSFQIAFTGVVPFADTIDVRVGSRHDPPRSVCKPHAFAALIVGTATGGLIRKLPYLNSPPSDEYARSDWGSDVKRTCRALTRQDAVH